MRTSRQFQFPPLSGYWYQVERTVLAGAIGIQTRLYQLQLAGGPLTCSKTNLRCIITGGHQRLDRHLQLLAL